MVISKTGVAFRPHNLHGLRNFYSPQYEAELCENVNGMGWMSAATPNLATRIAIHKKLLEKEHERTNESKKKRSIARYCFSDFGWTKKHEQSFSELQAEPAQAVTMAHRNPELI